MDKQLIILAFYLNIKNHTRVYINDILHQYKSQFENIFKDNDNYKIEVMYVFVEDRPTEIKCIYPSNITDQNCDEFIKISNSIIEKNKDNPHVNTYKTYINKIIRKIKLLKIIK